MLRRIQNLLHHRILSKNNQHFGDDKSDLTDKQLEQNQLEEDQTKKPDVTIDEKYHEKSATLYDKYLLTRDKQQLSLDEYQIYYGFIIKRMPIFIPYHPKDHQFQCNRTYYGQKTGYSLSIPKQLQIQKGQNVFEQFNKINYENQVTHRKTTGAKVQEYREHSRVWKYCDPMIRDPKSVQTYSSENVYFITQDHNGEWRFPQRAVTIKQTHDDFFKEFTKELFGGDAMAIIDFSDKYPILTWKQDNQLLARGKGIRYYFYRATSMCGIPKFPNRLYHDYSWVPKPLLGQYFHDQYFQRVIRSVSHIFF